jgi:immune inhibitor A
MDHSITFSGATVTPLLPVDPHSGNYAFWSNKSNESNTSLIRSFDLTGVSSPVTLTYWTWFDLETDYDYVYLEASIDGETWEIIITPKGTAENPSGNGYGWGYNDKSNGWIQETIDLSKYAGENIILRFDYITDAAVVNDGFLLDDISIPAIGYWEDFETGDGGWEAAGFVRVQNVLPQTYRLALIKHTVAETSVEIIPVNPDQTAEIPLNINNGEDVVLVVTATTRFTGELAPYEISIH